MELFSVITLIIGLIVAVIGWWFQWFSFKLRVILTFIIIVFIIFIILAFGGKKLESGSQGSDTKEVVSATTTSGTERKPTKTTETTERIETVKRIPQKWETCQFGNYEQNQNKSGKEPIEWVVFAINSEYVYLLSQYILDVQPFHKSNSQVTYDKSSIRIWLNNSFLQAAFSKEEQKKLVVMDADIPHNYDYPSTNQGGAVEDKVALMSIEEIKEFFSTSELRKCMGTPYAFSRALFRGDSGCCPWWTRSMGETNQQATIVRSDGLFNVKGWSLIEDWIGVRPCICLELEYFLTITK